MLHQICFNDHKSVFSKSMLLLFLAAILLRLDIIVVEYVFFGLYLSVTSREYIFKVFLPCSAKLYDGIFSFSESWAHRWEASLINAFIINKWNLKATTYLEASYASFDSNASLKRQQNKNKPSELLRSIYMGKRGKREFSHRWAFDIIIICQKASFGRY